MSGHKNIVIQYCNNANIIDKIKIEHFNNLSLVDTTAYKEPPSR